MDQQQQCSAPNSGLGAGRAKANCSSLRRESLKLIIVIIVIVVDVAIVVLDFIVVLSTTIIICMAMMIGTVAKGVPNSDGNYSNDDDAHQENKD